MAVRPPAQKEPTDPHPVHEHHDSDSMTTLVKSVQELLEEQKAENQELRDKILGLQFIPAPSDG